MNIEGRIMNLTPASMVAYHHGQSVAPASMAAHDHEQSVARRVFAAIGLIIMCSLEQVGLRYLALTQASVNITRDLLYRRKAPAELPYVQQLRHVGNVHCAPNALANLMCFSASQAAALREACDNFGRVVHAQGCISTVGFLYVLATRNGYLKLGIRSLELYRDEKIANISSFFTRGFLIVINKGHAYGLDKARGLAVNPSQAFYARKILGPDLQGLGRFLNLMSAEQRCDMLVITTHDD
jgi:hypothetical protein